MCNIGTCCRGRGYRGENPKANKREEYREVDFIAFLNLMQIGLTKELWIRKKPNFFSRVNRVTSHQQLIRGGANN